MAVQIGRARGAEVVGVCRGADADLVQSLGAVRTLDYEKNELEHLDDRFDIIFDTVNDRPPSNLLRLLTPNGVYTSTGFSPSLILRAAISQLASGRRLRFIASRADGELMQQLSKLVESGEINPVIDSTWPLDDIRKAYDRLEHEHTQGKVVITLS